jgi:hypothetical protein
VNSAICSHWLPGHARIGAYVARPSSFLERKRDRQVIEGY